MFRIYLITAFYLALSFNISAQAPTQHVNLNLAERVSVAPESVFRMFREAGMSPSDHELTAVEKAKVEKTFAALPPLHQKILKGHLHSISFMDNMPNTALTSPVKTPDSTKMYNITFRAGILQETISEWATQKELTCFDQSENPGYEIKIEAGGLDAFLYVLLHEATHVVDAVLEITPHPNDIEALVKPTPFTQDVWQKMNVPTSNSTDSLLEKTRFRSGKTVALALAPNIYQSLGKTPFASLYGMASWFEDIAELASIYHLTEKMDQPFYVVVRKDNEEIFRFEPMRNKLVKKRLRHLKVFYRV
ncbi:hypothetical protein [Pontibacter harenae]|uniref:hypothetical protein n=1 Tax=Pontibacter harenae TaxID=2894083 RepID=UPI001E5B7A90|nr:hypothetical protein [Pontibacter harenae]MCC9168425.1 hypothetical protein [Pontibacter harenae]